MPDPTLGAAFITLGHPVDTEDRRVWLTGGPIDVAEKSLATGTTATVRRVW